MTVGIRSQGYTDRMGRSRRHHAWFKSGLMVFAVMALIGAGAWTVMASPLFHISDIHVSGGERIGADRIIATIRASGPHNLLLARAQGTADLLRHEYPSLEQVQVSKDYPHALRISVTERQAMGSWCRVAGPEKTDLTCQLFNAAGVRWGSALPSSGPLLLLVQDQRSDDVTSQKFFDGLLAGVHGLATLGLTVKSVRLPDAEPGAIYTHVVKGYDVYLDGLGDVSDQLQVLEVFLADRAKDPAFSPQYIDLRTPGRVYYK